MKLGFPSCISILFFQREQMGVRTIKRRKRLFNTGISAILKDIYVTITRFNGNPLLVHRLGFCILTAVGPGLITG